MKQYLSLLSLVLLCGAAPTGPDWFSPAQGRVASIAISPKIAQLELGDSGMFKAVVKNQYGDTLKRVVSWTIRTTDTSEISLANVADRSVTVVAKKTGTSYLVGSVGNVRDSASITTVQVATVTSVSISPTQAVVGQGATWQFTANAAWSDGLQHPAVFSWSATGGTVTQAGLYTAGQVGGSFLVTVSSGGKSASAAVTVQATATLSAVVVSPASATIPAGSNQQFTITPQWSDGGTHPFTASWAATGGTTTSSGLYTAGAVVGTAYRIIGTINSKADTSTITIMSPSPCASTATVCAGPDVLVRVNTAITLAGEAPAGQFVFWTKISGPGEAVFSHEMFNASFEDGTVNEWIGDGGGGQAGGGFVTTEQAAHSGTHTWKAYNDPAITDATLRFSAKLLRSRFDIATGYYSAWYWFPTGYASGYSNIFQYKEDANGVYDPTWIVIARNGFFGIHDYKGGTGITMTTTPIPLGRWVNITGYMKASTSGQFIVWVDGQVIFNRSGINTLGTASTLMWGVGNYGSDQVGKWLYVDDTEVADATKEPRTASVTFSQAGTYQLRLSAYDGTTTRSDDVTMTVSP